MAQLQHLIANPTELWEKKDSLKPAYRFELLSEDPMRMHKTKFTEYLRAKVEAIYRLEKLGGRTHDDAVTIAAIRAKEITDAWKLAARTKSLHTRSLAR